MLKLIASELFIAVTAVSHCRRMWPSHLLRIASWLCRRGPQLPDLSEVRVRLLVVRVKLQCLLEIPRGAIDFTHFEQRGAKVLQCCDIAGRRFTASE